MSDYWKKKMDELNKSNAKSSSSTKKTSSSSSSDYWGNKMSALEKENKRKKAAEEEAKKKQEYLAQAESRIDAIPDYAPIKQAAKDELRSQLGSSLSNIVNRTNSALEPIKPIAKEAGKIELFQAGAYEDVDLSGPWYEDLGNVALATGQAILGTGADAVVGIAKGGLKYSEGIADSIAYGIADVGEFFGADMDHIKEEADYNTTDEMFADTDEYLDKYSLFGRTTDYLAEGVGQLGTMYATASLGKLAKLGLLGTTALTTGTNWLSSYGGSRSEAKQSGATDEEARKYASIAATADAVTEMFFSGLGKGINAVGYSKGLFSADDMLAKALTKNIESKLAKNLVQYGVKAGAESFEEVLAGFAQAWGKHQTYMSEKDLWDIVRDENLLEQAVVAALTSAIAQGGDLAKANKSGRDFITGLNTDEQTVVDKAVQAATAEKEKKYGRELTNKEKTEIAKEVRENLDRGGLDIDSIAEFLGGESVDAFIAERDKFFGSDAFKAMKEAERNEQSLPELQKKYDELHAIMPEKKTGAQQNEEASLLERIQAIKNAPKSSDLRAQLDPEAQRLMGMRNNMHKDILARVKDSLLAESYLEDARSKQKLDIDINKYTDENARKTVQNIIDSGLGDNSNSFKSFVDLLAKISADKKTIGFDLTNNERLYGTDHSRTGLTTNGYKLTDENGTTIVINKDAANPLRVVVGHEFTHALESSGFYDAMADSVLKFAELKEGKANLDARIKEATRIYKDDTNTTPEKEVVADLIGEYVFTDYEFISNLAKINHKGFMKLFDEIKYLSRIATAGSKVYRELAKVKNNFERAYRENGVADSKENGEVQHSYGKTVSNTNYSLENGRKRKYNKRSRYSETETLFLSWENGSAPVGEVKKFVRYGKTHYYEKTENGSVELSRSQYNERNGAYVENIDRRAERRFSTTADYDESTQRGTPGYSDSHRDSIRNAAVFGQTIRERLPDVSAGSVSSALGHDSGTDITQTEYNDEASEESDASFITFSNDYNTIRNYMKDGDKASSNVQYSLSSVEAVEPHSDLWHRTHTTDEAKAIFPDMWNVAAEDSEVRNPTQITSTVKSYRKVYDFLKTEGFDGTILDASSGLGYGTKAGIEEYGFDVEDIEPYPDNSYNPKYKDYSALDKKYDAIISNAVLNVLPQDQRDALVVKMGELLNDGGRIFINVRGKDVESLAKTGKNIHLGDMEWIETVKGSYQKGFTKDELVAYLKDALGDDFTVEKTNMFGAVSAIVTKDGGVQHSFTKDSEGNQLSKEQQEFFKDSKMRDADGSLKPMYHGSQKGGFHVFDPNYSDDDISLFFTDRNDVAMSYSGTSEVYEARTIRTAEDMNNFLAEIGQAEDYEVAEENGKFILLEDGDEVATSDTAQDIYQEFCDWVGIGYGDVNYKVYLNLANPLVMDAGGRNWNALDFKTPEETVRFEVQNVKGRWRIKDNLNGDYLEIDRAVAWRTQEYAQEALDDYVKKYPNSQAVVKTVLNKTRDIAQYAKAQGYDGVVFKNIRDNGGFSNGSEGASTVAIAFDSNQIKSTANKNPTADPDIRYSLSVDSDGRQLTENQKKYFDGSKVVDENGNLKAVYHGSPADFNTFSLEHIGTNGTAEGYGFYFTDKKSIAENYTRGREGQQTGDAGKLFEVYLDIKKPLSDTEVTISRQQFRKFLIELNNQVDADGEPLDVLSNYGDVEWEGLNKVINYAMEIEYDGSDNDVNLVSSIINGTGNLEIVLDVLRKTTGYDGIIVNEATWGGDQTIYLAFHPEQIKNVNNPNPTTDPDIRKSLSDAGKEQSAESKFLKYTRGSAHSDPFAEFAPVRQDVATQEATPATETDAAPVVENPFPNDLSPLDAELDRLNQRKEELEGQMLEMASSGNWDNLPEIDAEYKSIDARIAELEQEAAEENAGRLDSLTAEEAPPEKTVSYDTQADVVNLTKKDITDIARVVKDSLNLTGKQMYDVHKLIEDYSQNEFPSREQLFLDIKEKLGTYTEKFKDQGTADAKKYLRTQSLFVDDLIRADIADFADLRRMNRGKIRFSRNGIPVDVAYQELSGEYPYLFPKSILNPTDQFLQMVEVANKDSIAKVEHPIDDDTLWGVADDIIEYVDDIRRNQKETDADKFSKESFNSLMADADNYVPPVDDDNAPMVAPIAENNQPIENVIPTEEHPTSEAQKAEKPISETIDEKISAFQAQLDNNRKLRNESNSSFDQEIARLQAEYDAKTNKNTIGANDLLRRIERMKRLKQTVDADFGKQISNLESKVEKMSKPEYRTAEQRKVKDQEHTEHWKSLVGDTSTWKDMSLGLSYKTKTLRRILRKVVRDANGNPDIAKADAIYDALETKYDHNEALLKRESQKLKEVFQKLKLNSKEDTYAHMLGEFRHNPETTLTEDQVKDYYNKHKNRIDTNKVETAITEARKTFDELIVRVNEVLRAQGLKEIPYRKGYFPHFTNPKQGWLAKLFNWKTVDNEIPTSIAGLTEMFKPERSWQSFNKQRKGDNTDYSLYQGLDTYIHGALDWIYHIDDLQSRRSLENYLRYIHSDEGVKARIDEIKANETYDADEAQAMIDSVYKEANNPLSGLVRELMNRTNTLANKKSSMDRGMEDATNRKIYSVMTNLNNRVNANMVVGSFSSAFTNFIPMVQSWHQVSPWFTVRGLGDYVRSVVKDDGMIEKSDYLTNRLMEEENLYQTGWDKVTDKAAFMMNVIDSITSQTVWRSKYLQNIKEGMSESQAIKDADQFAKNLMAGRSRGNMPTIFDAKNPLAKAFTAFQLEVANQYGYMFDDTPKDVKNKARLVKGYAAAFLGAYMYNAVYSSLVGRNVAFDPIRIIEELLNDLGFGGDDEEEEEKELGDALLGFGENIIQEVPFVGGLFGGGRVPISAALPYSNDSTPIQSLMSDWEKGMNEGDWSAVSKELLKPLYYLAMPVGGGQLKKTVEGLSMFSDDHPVAGSYTDSGKLRFPVEDTFGNRLQAALFGQYASENARYYFDNDIAPLGEKQIDEYTDVDMPIRDYWKYRKELSGLDTVEEKLDYIDSLDLPTRDKNILANNVTDRKEDIEMGEYGGYSGLEEYDFAHDSEEVYEFIKGQGISYTEYSHYDDEKKEAYRWAAKNPEKFAVSKAVTSDLAKYRSYTKELYKIRADYDTDGKAISGSAKEKKLAYINGLDLEYGQKIILYRSLYDSEEDRAKYNGKILDYLNGRDDLAYEEKVTILKELDFTVLDDGTVLWD